MKFTLSKKQWQLVGRKAGWMKTAEKYLVVDNDFNKENYPDLVGQILSYPPGYAQVKVLQATDPQTSVEELKKKATDPNITEEEIKQILTNPNITPEITKLIRQNPNVPYKYRNVIL